MILFESILVIMFGAVILAAASRRVGIPYPVVLAIGGTALAFIPNAPRITLDPELVLALFVAPILLDAAFDSSPRDLRRNWLPVSSLVFVAVGVTTAAVALVTRWLVPDIPWAAAIALGAIVAPPDAVAATAILRKLRPPHRIVVIVEGESLLNDATALLIYRLAVGSVAAGSFSAASALPAFALVTVGSIVLGALLGWVAVRLLALFRDPASAIIVQFITTFGVWILAERLHLSGIITVVVYGIVLARTVPAVTSARLRIPSYAVWETTVFVLQVLAFVLVGLQLRPILEGFDAGQRVGYAWIALAVLATVILVRLTWVATYRGLALLLSGRPSGASEKAASFQNVKGSIVIAWCGMRGIVTLAAAFALPADFPYRDLILLCAFTVVVGTLLVQGLTLAPLLRYLAISDDHPVDREFAVARKAALEAAIGSLEGVQPASAAAIRQEYRDMLEQTGRAAQLDTDHNALRRTALAAARKTAFELRKRGTIGDDAFHRLEEELDWLELGAAPREGSV
ncbi:cation:proton antiporter [Bosea sp. NPDC003192]|uniref:cation:proton antiporter n=1 Tax=Bosea sp. NPDC003192 TaxID=3390551 RepID=UPI003CFEB970